MYFISICPLDNNILMTRFYYKSVIITRKIWKITHRTVYSQKESLEKPVLGRGSEQLKNFFENERKMKGFFRLKRITSENTNR